MSEIYDTAILGAGPAGISAAIYAARAKLNALWLDKQFEQGGQVLNTYEVDNYPGMPGISGMDLGEAMAGHAAKLGIEPFRENVLSVEDAGTEKIIRTKKFDIKPMYPEDACVQMELLGHNFFVFCNAETDEVNVVYKRKGGTYGLIEPEN